MTEQKYERHFLNGSCFMNIISIVNPDVAERTSFWCARLKTNDMWLSESRYMNILIERTSPVCVFRRYVARLVFSIWLVVMIKTSPKYTYFGKASGMLFYHRGQVRLIGILSDQYNKWVMSMHNHCFLMHLFDNSKVLTQKVQPPWECFVFSKCLKQLAKVGLEMLCHPNKKNKKI
jgi:hypothetical protein